MHYTPTHAHPRVCSAYRWAEAPAADLTPCMLALRMHCRVHPMHPMGLHAGLHPSPSDQPRARGMHGDVRGAACVVGGGHARLQQAQQRHCYSYASGPCLPQWAGRRDDQQQNLLKPQPPPQQRNHHSCWRRPDRGVVSPRDDLPSGVQPASRRDSDSSSCCPGPAKLLCHAAPPAAPWQYVWQPLLRLGLAREGPRRNQLAAACKVVGAGR